jgi:homocysteine S-methyltransferase
MTTNPMTCLGPNDRLLTDGGLETVLVFQHGLDLPAFAAFPQLHSEHGRGLLRAYFREYLAVAAQAGTGFVLETPTWRANRDWAAQLGYSPSQLTDVAYQSVELARDLQKDWTGSGPVLVSGCIGPRGDGYVPGLTMSTDQAADYHRAQVADLTTAGADLVTSFTFSYPEEGAGVAAAAAELGTPCVIGFTVETDGRLPCGTPLGEAIAQVDAATGGAPAWYMINCAHPDHVLPGLPQQPQPWMSRIGAYRANASRLSHAELDQADQLDDGDPGELAQGYLAVRDRLPALRVLGGCCGTDIRHITAIAHL